MSQRLDGVERAVEALGAGEPILVHDFADREAETDLIYPAADVVPADVARLRNDAGGLLCVALDDDAASALDLPLLDDELSHPAAAGPVGYDDRSSFSLTVNHRDTYTGVTDRDRAKTISALADASAGAADGDYGVDEFAAEFRAPGHVHLLRAAPSLSDRRGHTELGIALADAAGREPAVVVCEMLDDASGEALSPAAARDYAERHDLAFVEGEDVVEALG